MEVYVIIQSWNYPGDSGTEALVFAKRDDAMKAFEKISEGALEEVKEKYPDTWNCCTEENKFAAWEAENYASAHYEVVLINKIVK